MNSVFSEQILADKLSKLNNTQQCIETLSHWCIFHRSKAELVVTTWEKQFHSSEMAQKVPLLYLANDILQNSKRKGNEFVNEFWKVLPAALKNVIEKGDDRGKNVVSRLVNIWEERRVFGSREKSLKDVMLGAELPAPLELNKKRPRAIRIVKRDSRSIRTKLSIGGAAEKIVSAYHLVLSEHPIEDIEMNKCKAAVNHVRKIEKDVDAACTSAKDPNRKNLSKELEGEEILLQQCIDKLKLVEASRVALVARLREALHEQESELENVRTQMQVAHAQVGEASSMRNRLNDENYIAVSKPVDANAKVGQAPKRSASALAAAVADKLTASTSSQLIMSSVLSTFAAQEAKNAELTKSSTTSNSSSNAFMLQPNPYQLVAQSTMPAQAQAPISQPQYQLVPNPPSQQYMQPSGTIVNPYGYGSIPPLPSGPPPPPLQTHLAAPMMPLNQQPLQMGQQPPVPPSFRPLQPPAMAYYGHVQNSQ